MAIEHWTTAYLTGANASFQRAAREYAEEYAAVAVAAERARWSVIAHRVAADANRYGLEGLRMRCTISESGGLVSWNVDKAGFAKPATSEPVVT